MKDFIVNDEKSLEKMLSRVRTAQEKFASYTQEQVDKIFFAAAAAADKARITLAKMASSNGTRPSAIRASRSRSACSRPSFLPPIPPPRRFLRR